MATVPLRRSIRTKIFAGFCAMGVLTGGLGAFGIYSIAGAGRIVVDTYDYPLMAINFARAASVDFSRMYAELLRSGHAATGAEQTRAKMEELQETFFDDLKIAEERATHPRAAGVIQDIKTSIAKWDARWRTGLAGGAQDDLERLSDEIIGKFDLLIELTAEQSFIARQRAVSAIGTARSLGIAAATLALLLSFALAVLLARQILRPLSAAAAVADRIAAGELQTPIPRAGADETGVLLHSMSVMQENIRDMMLREAAARDRAEQDKERAEIASRAKSDFLASMSHELRTPLNSILGFAQLLEFNAKQRLSPRQERHVAQIKNSGKHLLSLIDEVLDLGKIEAGNVKLSIERVPLATLLEQVRSTLQPIAAAAGVRFSVEPCNDRLAVRADSRRLLQVLINLGGNAIKYNRQGGSARLAARLTAPDLVSLTMTDTGIGIPLHQQSELFQPFKRLGAERSSVPGTGIGLAVSKRLVQLMKGQLLLLRSEPGWGSTFAVELPAAAPDARLVAPDAAPDAPIDHANGYSLLYVEDDPVSVELMHGLLEDQQNVRLLTATTAGDGLAIAQANRPDVIVLDINLPDADGFELLAQLRTIPSTAAIPVIALSASAMPRDVERGRAMGFTRYLTKPVDVAEFLAAIDGVLGEPV